MNKKIGIIKNSIASTQIHQEWTIVEFLCFDFENLTNMITRDELN